MGTDGLPQLGPGGQHGLWLGTAGRGPGGAGREETDSGGLSLPSTSGPQAVALGDSTVVLAGGMESMSRWTSLTL